MSEYRVGSLAHANAEKSYTPKVGDKVRATLGENVLVGHVLKITGGPSFGDGLWLDITGLPKSDEVFVEDGVWTVEQIVSVPSKFGAVIRRADGVIFINAPDRDGDVKPWLGANSIFYGTENATAGGFTVLFDGVDE